MRRNRLRRRLRSTPQAPPRVRRAQPKSNQSTILIEGGDDFDEDGSEEFDEENEPNFNRVEGAPVAAGQVAGGSGRPSGGEGGGNRRRRRRRGGRPAGGGRQG